MHVFKLSLTTNTLSSEKSKTKSEKIGYNKRDVTKQNALVNTKSKLRNIKPLIRFEYSIGNEKNAAESRIRHPTQPPQANYKL